MEQKLYILQCRKTFAIKIGISNDPIARMRNLQTGYPFDLSLLGVFGGCDARTIERHLHQALSRWQLRGEWFEGAALPQALQLLDRYRDRMLLDSNFLRGKDL